MKPALGRMWRIFDFPCGQRLKTMLRDETDRLRMLGELDCSNATTAKLKAMLYKAYQKKNQTLKIAIKKKTWVRFLNAQPELVSVR